MQSDEVVEAVAWMYTLDGDPSSPYLHQRRCGAYACPPHIETPLFAGKELTMQSDWQPIETAPKDGTFVVLYVPHGEPPVSIGYYDGGPEWLFVEADILPTAAYPKYWQPLPTPPKEQTDAE